MRTRVRAGTKERRELCRLGQGQRDRETVRQERERAALAACRREALFEWPVTEYEQTRLISRELQPMIDVWGAASEFATLHPAWMDGSFTELDAEEVEHKTMHWIQAVSKQRI
eukprot:1303832-Pleurochrysis_carterae.AAC.3